MPIPNVFRHHFQHAYVVRNFEAASAAFREQFGVSKWHVIDMPEGAPLRRIGMAWVENVMIEFIEAIPGQPSIYETWIPDSASGARFHHLGYLIDDANEYRRVAEQFTAAGFQPAMAGTSGDILAYHYADTVAALGHYCELVHLLPAGRDFFKPVPKN